MENERKEQQLGSVGRDIKDAITKIVEQVCENASSTVYAKCDIPGGYVQLPSTSQENASHTRESKDLGDKVKTALSAALPAGLSALALAFNAPSAVVVILSGAGGVAGSFIQNTSSADNMKLSELELKKLELSKLSADDITIHLMADEQKKQELVQNAQKQIDALCAEVAAYEHKMEERHDIALDKTFGEWVQKFLIYADAQPDNRKIQSMRDELISSLASMKIYVYDEVHLDDQGKPDVPIQDYLIDSREGDSYQKVLRPAIYSDRSLLARGEIS